MNEPKPLNARQERWLQAKARGVTNREASEAAGFSPSYGKKIASRLRQRPPVVQAMADIQQKGRDLACYDLARAMQEAQEVIEFAKQHKQGMAYFKAVQHRAQLSGLLIEKHEVVSINLKAAIDLGLARAQARELPPRPALEQGAADPDPSTAQDPRPFTVGPAFGD